MFDKNSPEHHAHVDSDDDEIHIDPNDAFEVIDVDSSAENQLDTLDLNENMEEEDEEEDDDALLKISHHKSGNSIFTISIDPQTQNRVCTGGEDDRCLLWNLDTGDLIHEYPSFDDSVHQICWSFDGKYLCACDMRGQIRCWTDNENGLPINEVWSFHTGIDIELMRFHPSAHVLFVGTNDSQLWLFKIPSGEYKIMHGGSDTEILTLEILTNGKKKKFFVFFTQNLPFFFLLQVNNVYVVMVMVILNYGILNNLQLFGNMIIVVKVIVQ
jgi:WD40 repeat protein